MEDGWAWWSSEMMAVLDGTLCGALVPLIGSGAISGLARRHVSGLLGSPHTMKGYMLQRSQKMAIMLTLMPNVVGGCLS
jgi:hypothetical protein